MALDNTNCRLRRPDQVVLSTRLSGKLVKIMIGMKKVILFAEKW
jgi:hypothetical protein